MQIKTALNYCGSPTTLAEIPSLNNPLCVVRSPGDARKCGITILTHPEVMTHGMLKKGEKEGRKEGKVRVRDGGKGMRRGMDGEATGKGRECQVMTGELSEWGSRSQQPRERPCPSSPVLSEGATDDPEGPHESPAAPAL